jgi:hypothetical protein
MRCPHLSVAAARSPESSARALWNRMLELARGGAERTRRKWQQSLWTNAGAVQSQSNCMEAGDERRAQGDGETPRTRSGPRARRASAAAHRRAPGGRGPRGPRARLWAPAQPKRAELGRLKILQPTRHSRHTGPSLTSDPVAGNLRSMVDFRERSSARRWVFSLLVLFLVFGHVCDLQAYADVVSTSHTAEESHHSGGGHHGGEQELSCDPTSATSSPGQPQVAAAPELSVASPVNDPVPARMVARSVEGPAKFAVRPPLFLLHASLLI